MRKVGIGLDIGGTNSVAAAVSEDGKIFKKEIRRTPSKKEPRIIIKSIVDLLRFIEEWSLNKRFEIVGIGLGIPGLIDFTTGVVEILPNFPKMKGFPIIDELKKYFSYKLRYENDASAALLGEYRFGAGKGVDDLICFTLGTGIGGAVLIDGKLLRGPEGFAGELGHITLDPDGPLCGCGNRGCLEALASASAIVRRAKEIISEGKIKTSLSNYLERGEELNASIVAQEANKGDLLAQKVYEEAGKWLGIAIGSLANIFNVHLFLVGGGIANAGDILFNPMKDEAFKRALPGIRDKIEIKKFKLGEDAGVIGASSLVFYNN
ncbi:MAG: ROK family protein [Actinomycetota bacterium]